MRLDWFAVWLGSACALAIFSCDGDGGGSQPGGNAATGGSAGSGAAGSGGTGGHAGSGGTGAAGGGGTGTAGTAGGGSGGCAGAGGHGMGGFLPGCSSICHGGPESPAPPPDTTGETATTAPGVGAHQAHLSPSTWHLAMACHECHLVPRVAGIDPCVPTHYDSDTDIVWGPLAYSGTYDTSTHICSGTYCHGAMLQPDKTGLSSIRSPNWIVVDGTQDACGSACHTLPPGGTHEDRIDCETCHGDVISFFDSATPSASVWADSDLHIDGIYQWVAGGGGAAGAAGGGGTGGS